MNSFAFRVAVLGIIVAAAQLGRPGVAAELGTGDRTTVSDGADAEQIHQLVEQLGHPKFAQREAAARQLLAIGLPAYGSLADAAGHADPEVRFRAAKILAEVRQRDFQRRLHAFASNLQGPGEYELPGWTQFRNLAEDTRDTRELFVKMQTDEPRLMQSIDEGPRSAGDLLNVRCLQLLQPVGGVSVPGVSLGSAAAILFVASQNDVPLSDLAVSGVYRICLDEVVRDAAAGGPYQSLLRSMLSNWISRESSTNMDYQRLTLAMQYDLKAGLAPAVQILGQAGHPPHLRQQAMVTVAKFGDLSHLPLLERYLTDESQYGARRIQNKKTVQTEMRDVALAALIALTKQRFADYGMDHVTAAPSFVFIPYSCGFETPEARTKALAKWQEYRAKVSPKNAEKPEAAKNG